ncbi:MAG: branched-chain amino acid ABC transporter permease [Dethiobacteria bacterium]|jgi:branched-chain amino acid transport system permease protein|nr:branched-chain amino acid ABC transporter permease [Bacillota bacterium]HOA36268.1 branched-chain amino acid ABC transporter permease [Bacillota bacterium]
MLANILVTTLVNAAAYAMLAVGFSLIFGVGRIINLAHTAYYMLAGFSIYTLVATAGCPAAPAVLLTIALITVIAVLCYKLLIDPMREHETTVLIITIALALVFQELMLKYFGGQFRSVPSLARGFFVILGVQVTRQHALTCMVLVLILGAVWLLLQKTRLGLAIRATAQDKEVANLMGMDVSRIAAITAAISAALAATAGALVAPLNILEPHMWLHPLTIILAIVVLGGLGSIKGSILGAVIIALSESLVIFLLPQGSFLKGAFSLLIMIIVLLIRPEGLFGVALEGER